MRSLFLICSLALSPVLVWAQTYSGPQQDIDTILKNTAAFSAAYMQADYEALANSYTEDAKILPPGADIIAGRKAIKQRWQLPEGVTILHHQVRPQEIEVHAQTAYDMGYYEGTTRRADGTEVSWKGKYVIVWKKIADDWKIYLDAWNRIND